MTVIFYKGSIAGAVLLMLVGCSYQGTTRDSGQLDVQQGANQAQRVDPSVLEGCLPEAGSPFAYRKALLVAGTVSAPDLARDLPGLALLTSKRLQSHLDSLERFNVLATHDSSFKSAALDTPQLVMEFGKQYSSQFVVKLELQDLTLFSKSGQLGKLLGSKDKRNVLIKMFVYDAENGALFHSKQYQNTVRGDVVGYPSQGRAVTVTYWFNTDLGKQIDAMLKDMSMQINERLACVPFSTTVTAVKGNDIHLNAGYLNGIRAGESLRVYRRSDILETDGSRKSGINDEWIRVDTVFPNKSIAKAIQNEANIDLLEVGDVVRAW